MTKTVYRRIATAFIDYVERFAARQGLKAEKLYYRSTDQINITIYLPYGRLFEASILTNETDKTFETRYRIRSKGGRSFKVFSGNKHPVLKVTDNPKSDAKTVFGLIWNEVLLVASLADIL